MTIDTRRPWCTTHELAAWLDVSSRTVAEWRRAGTGPRYLQVGRTVRYLWTDVYKWANERREVPS